LRHNRHDLRQKYEPGAEAIHLIGWGLMGSRSVVHPVAETGKDVSTTTLRAYRGVLKVYANADDVVVTCKGKGYKATRINKDGHTITKCKGIGVATITGSEFSLVLRAKAMQARFPVGFAGTTHKWAFSWAGDLTPVRGEDDLTEEEPPVEPLAPKEPAPAEVAA